MFHSEGHLQWTCFSLGSLHPKLTVLKPLANFLNLRSSFSNSLLEGSGQRGHLHKQIPDKHSTLHQLMDNRLVFNEHNHCFVHPRCKSELVMSHLLTSSQQNLLHTDATIWRDYPHFLQRDRGGVSADTIPHKNHLTNHRLVCQPHSVKVSKSLPDHAHTGEI